MPALISTVLLCAAGLLLSAAFAAQASAAKRVALVIGNAAYAHAPRLANPTNDATDIGAALGRLGFRVTRLDNADFDTMRRGLRAFTRAAAASDIAMVFYAGHGIEVDGRNFLIPVDARLASDQDVEYEAVPLDLVSRSVDRASELRLIVLDACRDNPFARQMTRSGATRSIGRGLARIEPAGETLVAYAAKDGSVAADGEGRNSPYSEALLAQLEEPGLEVGLMFRKVRDAVLRSTGGRQEPFVYGSLSSKGAYLSTRPTPLAPQAKPARRRGGDSGSDRLGTEQVAAEAYKAAERIDTIGAYEAVIRRFPQSIYAALSTERIRQQKGGSETPTPAKPTPDVPARPAPESPAPPADSSMAEAALKLTSADRSLIQRGLTASGFDPGPTDGLFGRGTRSAISRWQASRGAAATGYLDADAARTLRAAGEAALKPFGPDWVIAENKPCQLWDATGVSGDEAVTWSGACVDGKASGQGRAVWRTPRGVYVSEGSFRDGKEHGHVEYSFPGGARHEGLWREGRPHGHGTYTTADGNVYLGDWRNGCYAEHDGRRAIIASTREACGFD